MRLKGRRTIALLVAAVLLLIGSVAGMIIARAEHEHVYWWEMRANPEEMAEEIIGEIAKAKGMSPTPSQAGVF